jgi:hypothetical protein
MSVKRAQLGEKENGGALRMDSILENGLEQGDGLLGCAKVHSNKTKKERNRSLLLRFPVPSYIKQNIGVHIM